jgi:hypothetical protein
VTTTIVKRSHRCATMGKWICGFSVAFLLLVFASPSSASSIVCGITMTTPDCQRVPAEYQWAPDSQPTFAVGCMGYPSPSDARLEPTPIVPSGNTLRFKLEATGQEITGGIFSETGIRCGEPCDPDAGWRNCTPSTLVRYAGPLAQGQQHKITMTGVSLGSTPSCFFTVSGVAVDPTVWFDAGVADGREADLVSTDAASERADWSPLLSEDALASTGVSDAGQTAVDGPSVDGPGANDPSFDGPSADGPSVDGPSANGPSVDGPSADSPSAAVGPTGAEGPAGNLEGKRSAGGCACTVGQKEHASLELVVLLAPIAWASRRRGGTRRTFG